MKCSRCDSPVSDTANFCEACGAEVRANRPLQKLYDAYRKELAGRLQEAAADYEALLLDESEGSESVLVRKHLANLHFRLGHLRRAREHLTRACELDARNATVWHDLGVIEYHLAAFDRSTTALQHALELDPGLRLAYFWLGNALYHQGNHAEAVSAFGKLIEHYPNFTIARFHLAVIYARQGDRNRAEEEFRRVLLNNPEDRAARHYVSSI